MKTLIIWIMGLTIGLIAGLQFELSIPTSNLVSFQAPTLPSKNSHSLVRMFLGRARADMNITLGRKTFFWRNGRFWGHKSTRASPWSWSPLLTCFPNHLHISGPEVERWWEGEVDKSLLHGRPNPQYQWPWWMSSSRLTCPKLDPLYFHNWSPGPHQPLLHGLSERNAGNMPTQCTSFTSKFNQYVS